MERTLSIAPKTAMAKLLPVDGVWPAFGNEGSVSPDPLCKIEPEVDLQEQLKGYHRFYDSMSQV
jgi:hypothetical protein